MKAVKVLNDPKGVQNPNFEQDVQELIDSERKNQFESPSSLASNAYVIDSLREHKIESPDMNCTK